MVTISIITAFFEGNQYIPKLIKITERNVETLKKSGIEAYVELIIVNDSPDVTVRLPYRNLDVSIKVINHEMNAGIHQARVTGLKNCMGDYIIFLDQDDVLEDDCLLEEYKMISDADVVVANAYIENPDGTRTVHFKSKGQYLNAFDVNTYIKAHNQIVSPGHCLIKKTSIPKEWTKYIMKTKGSDDLFLWILMLYCRCKFVMCDKIVYTHKYTGCNLSTEETKMAVSSMEVADYLSQIEYVPKQCVDAFVRNRRAKIEISDANRTQKLKIYFKNFDLFFPRVFWKIRSIVNR